MSKKDKFPWYKRIYNYLEGMSGKQYALTIAGACSVFLASITVWGIFHPIKESDLIKSKTTYTESSTVVPVYTTYDKDSKAFQRVITDLEFYNTKPEKTEVIHTVEYDSLFGKQSNTSTDSLIDNKDAESLYYHKGGSLNPLNLVDSLLGELEENMGTLILYNKSEKTYTTHTVKGIKFSCNSSKNSVEVHYSRDYSDYQGAPKPVYSYSPTVELTEYKDGTYMWKYKDNWKIENEDEIKSYISSAPKKED